MADFIAKFTYSNIIELVGIADTTKSTKEVETEGDGTTTKMLEDGNLHGEQWILYVDKALNKNGSGAGMMLISPEEHKIHCALIFGFQASKQQGRVQSTNSGVKVESE